MNLKELKTAHQKGEIPKQDYILRMYDWHRCLFDYSELMDETNVAEIKINSTGVYFTLKNPAISLWCPPQDTRISPIETFNFGDYEREELQTMRRLIASFESREPVFFDIGANAGFYSITLAKEFPNLKIHCFEPVPQTHEMLSKNIALNKTPRIQSHNFGFSSQETSLAFYTYPSQSGASSATRLLDHIETQSVTCDVTTLDIFCDKEKIYPDFIKCDVEGAELFVFQGGEKILAQHQPMIFSEMLRKWSSKFNYHPNDIIQLLQKLGYHCFTMNQKGFKVCEAVTDETIETNFIFLHKEKHSRQIQEKEIL